LKLIATDLDGTLQKMKTLAKKVNMWYIRSAKNIGGILKQKL